MHIASQNDVLNPRLRRARDIMAHPHEHSDATLQNACSDAIRFGDWIDVSRATMLQHVLRTEASDRAARRTSNPGETPVAMAAAAAVVTVPVFIFVAIPAACHLIRAAAQMIWGL